MLTVELAEVGVLLLKVRQKIHLNFELPLGWSTQLPWRVDADSGRGF